MRLNRIIKDAIAASALDKAGIPAREMAIRSRYAEWAETVRLRYVTPEAEALIEAARVASAAVPSLLRGDDFRAASGQSLYVNAAGMKREIYWNGAARYSESTREYRVWCNSYVPLQSDDPLVDQLYAIDHDAAALQSEKEQLNLSIRAVLDSVSTDKKLIEVWPEAVAFIPAAEKAATCNLPALPIAALNKMIGLP